MSSDSQRPIKSELEYYDFDQGSDEWLNLRQKFITASSIGQIINSGHKKTVSYCQLIAEKASLGEYRSFFGNQATRWGTKYEPVANMIYEHRNPGVIVYDYGLISNPKYPELAVSPDGITNRGEMLEIKCPFSRKIDGKIKNDYAAQMQQQLLVCEYDVCNFLECKFREFTEHEFWSTSSFTNESGIIIQSEEPVKTPDNSDLPPVKKKFNYYSPIELGHQPELLQLWYQYRLEDINQLGGEVVKTSFWCLDIYFCQKVKRDPDWYSTNHSSIRQFWNDVNEAKENGWQHLVNQSTSNSASINSSYNFNTPSTTMKKSICLLDDEPQPTIKKGICLLDDEPQIKMKKNICFLDDETQTFFTNSYRGTKTSLFTPSITMKKHICLLD